MSSKKGVEKKRPNKYFWNGNAKEHGAIVFKFAVWSSMVSGIVGLSATTAMMSTVQDPTVNIIPWGAATACLCWMIVWLGLFLACNFAYYALIESQLRTDTPPPPVIRREIFYVSENEAKIVYRD